MERYSLNHLFRTLGCFLLCVMFTATALAQQKTIKGTVVDAIGEPLIGVNVSVKGTTIGIITDIDGNYTVGGTLQFDYRLFLHRLSIARSSGWQPIHDQYNFKR